MRWIKLIINVVLLFIFIYIFSMNKMRLDTGSYEIGFYDLKAFTYSLIGGIGILIQYHNIMNNLSELESDLKFNSRYYAISFSVINVALLIIFIILISNVIFHNQRFYVVGNAPKSYYDFLLAILGIFGIFLQSLHIKKFIRFVQEKWDYIF